MITGRTTLSDSAEGQEHDVEGIYYFTGSEAHPSLANSGTPLYDASTNEWDAVVIDFAGTAAARRRRSTSPALARPRPGPPAGRRW